MLLEQLASVASVVSAVAVVASVIYASIQIRHNTLAVRPAAFQQIVNSFAAISFDIAKDKHLVDLYLRAGREFGSLSEAERAQYSLMLLSFLRRAENVLFQSSCRMLYTEHWSGIRESIKEILTPPGGRSCWAQIKNRLNTEFREPRHDPGMATKILLALGLMLSIVSSRSVAATSNSAKNTTATSVKIVAFNDFHGNLDSPGSMAGAVGQTAVPVGGVEYLAAYVAERVSHNLNHVVVSAGDVVGASQLISAAYHDEGTIEAMDLLGLDLSSVGNHDFDAGWKELLRKQNGGCFTPKTYSCLENGNFLGARFRYLAANVLVQSTGKTLFPAFTIKSFHGVRIAFVGLVLKGTPTIVLPSGVAGLEFRDEAETVKSLLPALRARHVNAIVVVIHQGSAPSSPPPGGTSINDCAGINSSKGADALEDIVSRLPDAVDLVISAHTHVAYNCRMANASGRLIPVTQASAFGRVITDIDMTFDAHSRKVASITATNVLVSRPEADAVSSAVHPFLSSPQVVAIRALVQDYRNAVASVSNQVIGSIAKALPSTSDPSGSGEKLAGDLVADSQLAATTEADSGGAVISFINGGGVRNPGFVAAGGLYPHDVTYQEAFAVRPFADTLVTMTFTAQQLKDVLEQQFAGCSGQTGDNILEVSRGFHEDWSRSASPCNKVVNVTLTVASGSAPDAIVVNHVVQHPTQTYRVSMDNFLGAGKSNFTAILKGTDQVGGPQDIDALVNYLQTNFKSPNKPFDPTDATFGIPRVSITQ